MTRILFLAERFPPDIGGVATSASRIANSLIQLGIEIDILVWSRYLQPGEIRREEGLPVFRIGLYRHWDMTMNHTLNFLDWLHEKHPYDAVWGHYLFPSGFLAVWFAQLKGLASAVSARGNDVDRGVFPPGDFARLQWTLERANVVTAVSNDLAKKIRTLSRRHDIIVLKNAVDTDLFSPSLARERKAELRGELGIAEDEIVLGFSGELREKKGQRFLLEALTKVRAERPACLLIIGEVRPSQEGQLQIYSVEHPEDFQRSIISGHLSDPKVVAEYLQLCDVFLLPSVWDGLPNALLEAMSCGCVCIASDAGGIPEVIEHDVNGFILSRSQLHRLGDAVLECVLFDRIRGKTPEGKLELNEGRWERIGRAARDRILSEFSIEAEKVRLKTVLDKLAIAVNYAPTSN